MSKLSLTYESKLKGMINVADPNEYKILFSVDTETDEVSNISIRLADKNIFMFSFDYRDLKKLVERIEKGE